MAAGASSKSGFSALLIVIPFALFLAWSQRTEGPSRAELAQALNDAGRGEVRADDLRDVDCAARAAGGYACTWRQREDEDWRALRGDLLIAGGGWRIVEEEMR